MGTSITAEGYGLGQAPRLICFPPRLRRPGPVNPSPRPAPAYLPRLPRAASPPDARPLCPANPAKKRDLLSSSKYKTRKIVPEGWQRGKDLRTLPRCRPHTQSCLAENRFWSQTSQLEPQLPHLLMERPWEVT